MKLDFHGSQIAKLKRIFRIISDANNFTTKRDSNKNEIRRKTSYHRVVSAAFKVMPWKCGCHLGVIKFHVSTPNSPKTGRTMKIFIKKNFATGYSFYAGFVAKNWNLMISSEFHLSLSMSSTHQQKFLNFAYLSLWYFGSK